ncbi:MAG TPA: hypothetical protein VNV65_10635 [Candidatus Solibacter sp.]|jgi:hypothetical protein|nr:hypothetical protein [Candidatus Solibacter sp.]
MQDTRREILTQVAAGTMTPAEAATRLEEVERAQSQASAAPVGASAPGDIRGVRITSSYGRIVVLGDASVAQARIEGPHVARTENGVLVIETDDSGEGNFWFGGREGGHWWDNFRWPPITVWMNPQLELWVSTDAGGVTVTNVLGPIHAEVQAGSLAVNGFGGPLDLLASAGSIRGEGTLRQGASRIKCDMGSVRLALAPGSDVRVSAVTELGKVSIDNGTEHPSRAARWGDRVEAVYGAGSASLDIESQMGSITVTQQ